MDTVVRLPAFLKSVCPHYVLYTHTDVLDLVFESGPSCFEPVIPSWPESGEILILPVCSVCVCVCVCLGGGGI